MSTSIDEKFAPFAERMRNENMPELAIKSFKYYYSQLVEGKTGFIRAADIETVEDIPDVVIEKVEKLIEAGANVLVQNTEVAQKIKGKILTNRTIDNALNELSIAKDFIRDEDKIDFIHRNVDGIDIYFVSNKTNESIFETVTFRASNQQVEYWSPGT